jgi:hypothetical protein
MRDDPLTSTRVLRALELFAPQARPYNFDDHFDCWGLVQRVFDWLDDGYDVNEQLLDAGTACGWQQIGDRGSLLPGDLLATHAQPDGEFHCAFYCGRVGEHDLVYDSSPRARVPLFERHGGALRWVADRGLVTRYMRATETTDRLRNDGGAYLRLWDDRMRFVNIAVHARLVAGGAARERDLVTLRRAAGLSDLPFYCRLRLPRDSRGREVYDNAFTRDLDYYVPDGAPVADDDYETALERGAAEAGEQTRRGEIDAVSRRPPAPELLDVPPWVVDGGAPGVTWRYPDPARSGTAAGAGPQAAAATGCRVELWEETADLWKHRLLREDHDGPVERFDVPEHLLHADSRFAVVVYARGAGGFSAAAMTPFLYRPSAANPLLNYNAVRPHGLAPDGGAMVPAGEDVRLSWRIRDPVSNQAEARVLVFEGGCLDSGAPLVFEKLLAGPAAAESRCLLPAAATRDGQDYYWYVTPRTAAGLPAFAPAEGLFAMARGR